MRIFTISSPSVMKYAALINPCPLGSHSSLCEQDRNVSTKQQEEREPRKLEAFRTSVYEKDFKEGKGGNNPNRSPCTRHAAYASGSGRLGFPQGTTAAAAMTDQRGLVRFREESITRSRALGPCPFTGEKIAARVYTRAGREPDGPTRTQEPQRKRGMAMWPDARNKPPHQTPEWSRRVKCTVGPHAECHLTDALTDACEAEAIYTPPKRHILAALGLYARTIDRRGQKLYSFREVVSDPHWMRQWHRLRMTFSFSICSVEQANCRSVTGRTIAVSEDSLT